MSLPAGSWMSRYRIITKAICLRRRNHSTPKIGYRGSYGGISSARSDGIGRTCIIDFQPSHSTVRPGARNGPELATTATDPSLWYLEARGRGREEEKGCKSLQRAFHHESL